MMTDTPRCW